MSELNLLQDMNAAILAHERESDTFFALLMQEAPLGAPTRLYDYHTALDERNFGRD